MIGAQVMEPLGLEFVVEMYCAPPPRFKYVAACVHLPGSASALREGNSEAPLLREARGASRFQQVREK